MRRTSSSSRPHAARDKAAAARFAATIACALLLACGCNRDDGPSGAATAEPRAAAAANGAGGEQRVWFEPAEDAGVDFVHDRGPQRYLFPEIMGGGAGWLDYDGDGDLDLYFVQGGDLQAEPSGRPPNRLFRNLGGGRFDDVTEAAGVGDTGYGMGCTCGDYDGDGDTDLYVTNVGPNVLYRNDGDGTFTDVTAATGTGDPAWGTSAAMVDYDGDGDLDLFVVNYVAWSPEREIECRSGRGERDYCQPNNYQAPARDVLFRNDGGRFSDVSESAGLHRAFGTGLGIACGDLDGDGRVDLYVANDGMPNQLWINQGDGTFLDDALLAGCAVNMQGRAEAGMGVAAADIENDGDLDLFMTHLRDESNTFYRNEGGVFQDATATMGLSGASIRYTGFGMGFGDFDLDGTLDLYVANGRVGTWTPAPDPDDPYAEPDQVFRGRPGGDFEEIRPVGACAACPMVTSRAAAFADYDDDGDLDVVVVANGGPAQLLRNVAERRGSWIAFRVLDAGGGDALGASLRIEAGGTVRHRLVQAAYSYCASNDPRVHVGLGGVAAVDRVTVRWTTGRTQTFTGPFAAGRVHVLRR